MLTLSEHASLRIAQRHFSMDEVHFILEYGNRLRRTGVIFCQMRGKDVPQDRHTYQRYGVLIGTTVVLCKCGQYVVTLYHNEKAFKKDKRKAKYNCYPDTGNCPCCSSLEADVA